MSNTNTDDSATFVRLIPRETAIGLVINAVMSLVVFYLMFRDATDLKLGMGEKYTNDFLVQSFACGFFAAFPALVSVTLAIRKGKVGGRVHGIGALAIRSILTGLLAVAVFGGAMLLVASFLSGTSLSFTAAAGLKVVYAVLISVTVTPLVLRKMLTP